MSKVINVGLSTKSINAAIRELNKYQNWLNRKARQLSEALAEELQTTAQSNFDSAYVDDIVGYGMRKPDVNVTVEESGNIRFVVANGEDAIFVEFGAGVRYNGAAGASPHPKGAELNFTIGGYGKGMGKRKAWPFIGEDGKAHISLGTPAQMPMYNALLDITNRYLEIARRVFA